MDVIILSAEERLNHDYTHKVIVEYTDLNTTAALTKTLAIYPRVGTAAIGTTVHKVASRVVTAFAGTTTLAAEVGDGGDVDRNLVSFDMKSAANTWKVAVPSTSPSVFNAADTVDVLFTATVDNLTALTAGKAEFYLKVGEPFRMN